MISLADLFNVPREIRLGDAVYKLREPTLKECGQYQRWLEQEARASAAASTELQEEDRRNLLRDVNADIAAKVYSWGGEVCVKSLRTLEGVARIYTILCADQGLTFELARKAVDANLLEMAEALKRANESEDPEVKKALGRLLSTVGLPPNYLNSSPSASPTSSAPKRPSRSKKCRKRR